MEMLVVFFIHCGEITMLFCSMVTVHVQVSDYRQPCCQSLMAFSQRQLVDVHVYVHMST